VCVFGLRENDTCSIVLEPLTKVNVYNQAHQDYNQNEKNTDVNFVSGMENINR
jgi:hypothetical protein